jgi:hypothetical protein
VEKPKPSASTSSNKLSLASTTSSSLFSTSSEEVDSVLTSEFSI